MFVTEKAIGETRFKTADELNLPEHIYHALLLVREKFISGEIAEDRFNMTVWNTHAGCGSICCIGGWMDVLGNCDTLSFIGYRRGGVFRRDKRQAKAADALYYLTHPPLGATVPWSEITMKDAIKAINNFLTTGDSSWKTVRSDLI